MKKLLITLLSLCAAQACAAPISVRDDNGNIVTVPRPAQRIIAIAPHVTELLFAAGGGARIVGAVSYSDYPEAAKLIPRIGNNRAVDLERVIALKPDLIVVWRHQNAERQVDALRRLGIPLYHSEPRTLTSIPDSLVRLGQLMGTDSVAQPAAAQLRQRLAALASQYANRPKVRLFYQVFDKPLYTLNGSHIASDAMRLCGGENIFAGMKVTAPVVGVEAVLQEDPEAIFATGEKNDGGVNLWRQYPSMQAVRSDNLFTLDGDLVNRAGPRMVDGAAALCEKLELVRQRRKN